MPVPHDIAAETELWDTFAESALEPDAEPTFCWTQYAGHRPGPELLGSPRRALEIGCGTGRALASLAEQGIEAHGVVLSSVIVKKTSERWADTSAVFHHGEVLDWLTECQERLACVSTAVGRYLDPFAGLDVDEDGGVAVAALQSEVVDAEHSWHARRRQGQPLQHPQCGRTGDRDSKALRQVGACPARYSLIMKPSWSVRRVVRRWYRSNAPGDLLAEGLSRAAQHTADQAPYLHRHHHPTPVHRYVGHLRP